MSEKNLAHLVLDVLEGAQQRLAVWLDEVTYDSFGKPDYPCVPDATLKTLPKEYVAQVVVHFLRRSNRNIRAITLLCREDLAVEAQSVLRALVESTIDLRYVSTNPQPFVTQWCLHEDVLRYRYWKTRPEGERARDFGRCEKEIAARLRQLDKHRPKKSGKAWTDSDLARDWALSNVQTRDEQASERLKEADNKYYSIYKLLCDNTHGGTGTFRDFMIQVPDGSYESVAALPGRKLVFVAVISLICFVQCTRAAKRCGADLDIEDWDLDTSRLPETHDLLQAALADFDIPILAVQTGDGAPNPGVNQTRPCEVFSAWERA